MGVVETLKFYKPRFVLQFNHWGRTITLAGSQLLFVGGLTTLFYGHFFMFFVGLYAALLGGLIFPFVYPVAFFQKRGFIVVFQNYRIIGPALVVSAIPCFFALPTVLGAVPLTLGGTFYIIAAIRKEKCLTQEQVMKGGRI